MCSRCLACKVFDLLSYNRDTAFIRSIELEHTSAEIVWADTVVRSQCFTVSITRTRRVALLMQGSLMFCLYLAGHRTTYVEAKKSQQRLLRRSIRHLTFVDDRVFSSTATICSCDDTSSIVRGRLQGMGRHVVFPAVNYSLFFDPWLQIAVHNMLFRRLFNR